ncbi:MAG: aminoacyl-tRNA hydrolase [Planctomycetes bacterium]|nr:aminoacyl-tRNA hydrolase [Planctomycetota bacterium]
MSEIRLIIGLGNDGAEYTGTRHNVGFDVVELLAKRFEIKVRKKKFGAALGEIELEGKKLILLKPLQYMNNSGQAVATAAGFYRISFDRILVITDDMALEPGSIRIRAKGSAGGHNGLSDIIEKLGTEDFARLRIGIGKSPRQIGRDYVLSMPSKDEKIEIAAASFRAVEAVLTWAQLGVELAMNRFNCKNTEIESQ